MAGPHYGLRSSSVPKGLQMVLIDDVITAKLRKQLTIAIRSQIPCIHLAYGLRHTSFYSMKSTLPSLATTLLGFICTGLLPFVYHQYQVKSLTSD